MFDIDDTLIDDDQKVQKGFEHMRELFLICKTLKFPVYVVTARPDDDEEYVYGMMGRRGMHIEDKHLHMLPAKQYNEKDDDKRDKFITNFKFGVYLDLVKKHDRVLARFGDKFWDVTHKITIERDLGHLPDTTCLIFRDRLQGMCVSYKLPGAK